MPVLRVALWDIELRYLEVNTRIKGALCTLYYFTNKSAALCSKSSARVVSGAESFLASTSSCLASALARNKMSLSVRLSPGLH